MIFGKLNPEKIWHEHLLSALEALCDYALYKSTFLLTYFTYLIAQGKVATSDRWGRQVCKIFVSNFLRISLAKNH